MTEQTAAPVETSSTPAVMEVDRGPLVNLTSDERSEFRKTGELPKQPQSTEETASSDTGKDPDTEATPNGEADHSGETEPPTKPQENTDKPRFRRPTAEQRIAQQSAEISRLKAELEGRSKPTTEPEPKPVQQPQFTRPKPTVDDKKEDGSPKYSTYEDFSDDLVDWKIEQREAKNQREQREQEAANAFEVAKQQARDRYENFDEVVGPTATAIHEGVQPVIRQLLLESEVLPDLIFTIGSGEGELAKFLKMPPGKQARYIALTESLINDELHAAKEPKAGEEPPVKPQTRAPRPPSEAGGRAATPPDALEAAAKANDFRAFSAEANRRALAKLKT